MCELHPFACLSQGPCHTAMNLKFMASEVTQSFLCLCPKDPPGLIGGYMRGQCTVAQRSMGNIRCKLFHGSSCINAVVWIWKNVVST
jgi:hypothetical protein